MIEPPPIQKIATNGIQLAVEHSAGAGETLILLHGLTANRSNFYGLLNHGLADGYNVYNMDLRGRGLSDKPASGYSMADHAADVLGLMDAEGLEQAIFIGHSFGGLLSMYMAHHHPQRIKRMVIIDAGKEATHEKVLEIIKPSLERLGQSVPSWDVYINAIKNSAYYVDYEWNEEVETYYRTDVETLADGAVRSRVYAAGIEEAVRKIITDDWEAIIRGADKPALLIHAPQPLGAAPVLSEAGAQATLKLLPDAQYIQVPGNHITMMFGANAPHIVRAIRAFVGD